MRETAAAACDTCGKRFRVPDASKTYGCKACRKGRVRAVGSTATPTEACTECGAALELGARFCVSCGAEAETETEPELEASTKETHRRPRSDDKRQANAELRKASRALNVLRVLLWTNFALASILLIVWVLAGPSDGDTRAFFLSTALIATVAAFCVIGALNVRFNPLPWALGLAGMWTLGFVLKILGGEIPGLFSILWGFGLWSTVYPAVRMNKLIAKYPDLYTSHRLRGTTQARRVSGSEATRVATARRVMEDSRKRTWIKAGAAAAGIYAASGFGAYSVIASDRVPEPADAIEALTEAWSEGDVDALAGLFSSGRRGPQEERLRAVAENHEWRSWPALESTDLVQGGRRLDVVFDIGLEHGDVEAQWALDDGDWILRELEIPPPALGGKADEFVRVWNRKNIQELVALFRSDDPAKTTASVRKMLGRRGWETDRPTIRSTDVVSYPGSNRADQSTTLESNEFLDVRWVIEGGRWRVRSLRPPKR